jgi:hypothetical protein
LHITAVFSLTDLMPKNSENRPSKGLPRMFFSQKRSQPGRVIAPALTHAAEIPPNGGPEAAFVLAKTGRLDLVVLNYQPMPAYA